MPTRDDLSYLAGIIDGEGSIGIHNENGKPKGMRLTVGNTDPRLIIWLKETFGGSSYPDRHRKANWKESWKWTISTQQAAALLEQVLPWLRLKREQAEIGIAFQRLMVRGGAPRTPEVAEETRAMKEAITILNKRGL